MSATSGVAGMIRGHNRRVTPPGVCEYPPRCVRKPPSVCADFVRKIASCRILLNSACAPRPRLRGARARRGDSPRSLPFLPQIFAAAAARPRAPREG